MYPSKSILNPKAMIAFLGINCALIFSAFSQTDPAPQISSEQEPASALSAFLFKGRSQRGTSFDYNNLEPLPRGLMNVFDVKKQYKNVLLGSDFYDQPKKMNGCDSLIYEMGNSKDKFVPISDGSFFTSGKMTKIEEVEGYYCFKNTKLLPGIIPNTDIWMKLEGYKTAKTTEKNCLLIKFLIPESVGGKIKNQMYVLKADGKLENIENISSVDLSHRKEFSSYWIIPLNDPNSDTHLSGKGFSILGSFVNQRNCKNLYGLIYSVHTHGGDSSSLFFRRVLKDIPVTF